jgi:hypothetical protein
MEMVRMETVINSVLVDHGERLSVASASTWAPRTLVVLSVRVPEGCVRRRPHNHFIRSEGHRRVRSSYPCRPAGRERHRREAVAPSQAVLEHPEAPR